MRTIVAKPESSFTNILVTKNMVAYCSLALWGVDILFKLLWDNSPFQTTNLFFVIISFCVWDFVWFAVSDSLDLYLLFMQFILVFTPKCNSFIKVVFCRSLMYLLLSNMVILIEGVIIVNINIVVQIKWQYPLWLLFFAYLTFKE